MNSEDLGFFSPFIVIAGWMLFERIKNFYFGKDMFGKIGWIAKRRSNMRNYSSNVGLRDEDLLTYICKEQRKLNIPENLQLDYSNETEKENAEKILESHKVYVIGSYFSDDLQKSKNIYKLKSLEYYMFSLHCFLRPEVIEHRDYERKIYSFESRSRPYSYYTLTDYGKTYYKLYLITLMFVENNPNTRKLFEHIDPNHKKHIMDDIEKSKSSFVCFGQ